MSKSFGDCVTLTQDGTVATVTLDRGDGRNALSLKAMQALIDRGVIGDFRAPNVMRFGFTPLYLEASDITAAVDVLADVLDNRLWDAVQYKTAGKVT